MYVCIAVQFQNSHDTAGCDIGHPCIFVAMKVLCEAVCSKAKQRQRI